MATKYLGRTPSNATDLALFGQITGGSSSTFSSQSPVGQWFLPNWQQACRLRQSAPAKVVWIGDSLTEGQGATTQAQRHVDLIATMLRTNFYTPGVQLSYAGHSYYPPFTLTQGDSTFTVPATTGTVTNYQTMGLGLHSAYMNSAGSITWTITADSADLFYYTFPAAGTFTYSIDGATAVSINAQSASDLPAGGRTHISLGTLGSHTIKITWVSGNVIFHGIAGFAGDYNAGFQVWNAGRYGAISGNFTSTTDTGTANGTTTAAAHNAAVAAIAPHLVVIELGANDWLNDTSTGNGTGSPAYTQANLQQLITQCAAYSNPPDILLTSVYQLPQSQSSSSHTWSEYCAVMDTLVTNNSNVYHFSWRPRFTQPISTSLLRPSDNRHPNNTGYQMIADLLYDILVPTGEPEATWGGTI